MKSFINVEDIGDLRQALAEAQEIKQDRYKYQHLGKNKTLMMIFFNNSLRTRLSTQKAAMNLGMNVIVLDVNAGAWKLETEKYDAKMTYKEFTDYSPGVAVIGDLIVGIENRDGRSALGTLCKQRMPTCVNHETI